MAPRRVQGWLFAGSLLLVTLVLLFSAYLNIGSFRSNYVKSLIGSYSVAGGEARRQIEYALLYGKSLENFANIEEILALIPEDTPAIRAVSIILPDGRIVFDLQGPVSARQLPNALFDKADFSEDHKHNAFTWMLYEEDYHAFLPIHDRQENWVGTLGLAFDSDAVDQQTLSFLLRGAGYMMTVGLGALLLLALLLAMVRVVDRDGNIHHRRVAWLLIVVLSAAQLANAAVNITQFKQGYPELLRENAQLTGTIIRKTIEGVIAKGVSYPELVGVDDWFASILEATPEIGHIDIETDQGDILFSTDLIPGKAMASEAMDGAGTAGLGRAGNGQVEEGYSLHLPMKADASGGTATLDLVLAEEHVSGKVFDLVLDAATMLITSFFFMGELVIFFGLMLKRRVAIERSRLAGAVSLMQDREDLVRPLAFLLLLSGYLSVSFIPLRMIELYEPLFGLSRTVIIGLPITVEMFGAFLSSLFIGHAIDRRGWRPAFLGGILVFGIGTALSGLASTAQDFIAARGIVGLGYGVAWMALRGLVAAGESGRAQTKGFSVLNAGIFAGQNCGAVLGAMLAERLGFDIVFYLAAALVPATIGFALLLVPNMHLKPTEEPGHWLQRTRNFFGDPSLLAFLLLVTIPSAAVGMFLNYFFPIFAHSLGISQGNIGRGFLAYGVCMIYIGPLLIRLIGNRRNARQMMVIAGFLGVLSLTVFTLNPSFATAVAAVVLLGISESLGLVSQNSFFINLPAALAFGRGKALSVFSAIKKAGQMLGPSVFGLATILGTLPGIALIAGSYFVTTGTFLVLSRQGGGKSSPPP